MHDEQIAPSRLSPAVNLANVRDYFAIAAMRRMLSGRLVGSLHLTLPSGRSVSIGKDAPRARISFRSWRALSACIQRGTLGFAHAYLDRDIDVGDLRDVFEFFIVNREALTDAGRGLFQVRRKDRKYHRGRANTHAGSRRNISDHYDLGNAFYAMWLDPGMAYSSGVYDRAETTLVDAQDRKYQAVLDALELARGDKVLEIGCGWGGFVDAAAMAGANVHAITISRQQHDYTAERIRARGLSDRATVEFLDYRDTHGRYDKIASIEMIEAVGSENWATYFETLRQRLKPEGIVVLQAITIREKSFPHYARKPDFIQRYIFPGGMLPTRTHLFELAKQAGLTLERAETFGQSYARTLSDWRQAFHANWSQIEPLGFDHRFRRLWDYYLTYCEAGFRQGVVDVGIYKFRHESPA